MERYCYVFYVTHKYTVLIDKDGDDINEIKEIGVYSTKRQAQSAIQRFSILPGFSSYPNGFMISKERCYFQDQTQKENLHIIYSPYHERYLADSDCDYCTRGAFFESALDAEKVINDWRTNPKFSGSEEGFATIEYVVNQDIRLWNEGFTN